MDVNQLLGQYGYTPQDFGGQIGLSSSRLPLGTSALGDLFTQLGVQNWATPDSYSANEAGQQTLSTGASLTPEAIKALEGFQFGWSKTPGGYGNAGTFTARGPDGKTYTVNQADQSATQSALELGALAAAGFGGLGKTLAVIQSEA